MNDSSTLCNKVAQWENSEALQCLTGLQLTYLL